MVFRLCVMKYGFGKWNDIVKSQYLIGKTISQLCNQLQRMVGQQSLGEFYGLHIDSEQIYAANKDKEGKRKNGCLINTGDNPTKAEVNRKREKNKKLYGLSQKEIDSITIPVLKDSEMSNYVCASLKTKVARLQLLQREKLRLEELISKASKPKNSTRKKRLKASK